MLVSSSTDQDSTIMSATSTRNQSGSTVLHVLLIVVVLAIIGFVGWRVMERHKNQTTLATVTSAKTLSASSGTPQSTTLSPGTDNTSLNNDLNSINSSMNQSTQDASSASSAINDQQNEIVVPTN
jgi:uncharacterized protein HemX